MDQAAILYLQIGILHNGASYKMTPSKQEFYIHMTIVSHYSFS